MKARGGLKGEVYNKNTEKANIEYLVVENYWCVSRLLAMKIFDVAIVVNNV